MTPNGNNQKKRQRLAGPHKKEELCRSEIQNFSFQRSCKILGRCSRRENKKGFKYPQKLQIARKGLRADDLEAKKDGGTVDWGYLLSRVDSF